MAGGRGSACLFPWPFIHSFILAVCGTTPSPSTHEPDPPHAHRSGLVSSPGVILGHVVPTCDARASVLLSGSSGLCSRKQASIGPMVPTDHDAGRWVHAVRTLARILRLFCLELTMLI